MKQEKNRRAKRAEWWTGEGGGGGGEAAELGNPHPFPDFLARFTGRFFSLSASLWNLVPGYYNVCITHELNFIMILFWGDRNKYHVTI